MVLGKGWRPWAALDGAWRADEVLHVPMGCRAGVCKWSMFVGRQRYKTWCADRDSCTRLLSRGTISKDGQWTVVQCRAPTPEWMLL